MITTKNKAGIVSIVLSCALALSGCASLTEKADYLTQLDENECPYEEFIVVDVYDDFANYQGIQAGWFGEIVEKKFNMELNIIAPNVSGGHGTLFQMRAAAGDIGDLIIFRSENGVLNELVNAGLVYDMEDMLQDSYIMKYKDAIENLNKDVPRSGIYAIPSEISTDSRDAPSEALEPGYGPYIRWDLYRELGYPRLETLEDLLPVLKEMQERMPVNEEGQKTYGFSFFKEWDDNMMNAAKQPCCFYGYDECGFVLAKADGSDYQSVVDEDSLYIRMLRFFFEANQLGLIDPESVSQNYEACFEKYSQGRVFFSPWPWLGQSAYNTVENAAAGRGYMFAPVEDLQVYSHGCNPDGNARSAIAVGAKAKDPERMVDFINWLYSPEGICLSNAGAGATAGPEGLMWELGDDGPQLTDFGVEALQNGGTAQMPEEYGGGSWKDGISALNYKAVAQREKDDNGNYYYYILWDSVIQKEPSALASDWRRVMEAETTMEYLQKKGMLLVAPGSSYVQPVENLEESTIRNQCKNVIQSYSWDMVFAKDEAEFYELLGQMRETVQSYGYDKILETDMMNARAICSGQ